MQPCVRRAPCAVPATPASQRRGSQRTWLTHYHWLQQRVLGFKNPKDSRLPAPEVVLVPAPRLPATWSRMWRHEAGKRHAGWGHCMWRQAASRLSWCNCQVARTLVRVHVGVRAGRHAHPAGLPVAASVATSLLIRVFPPQLVRCTCSGRVGRGGRKQHGQRAAQANFLSTHRHHPGVGDKQET